MHGDDTILLYTRRLILSLLVVALYQSYTCLAAQQSCSNPGALASLCLTSRSARCKGCGAGVEMSAQMRWRPAYRSLPASIGRTKLMPPMAPRPPGFAPPFHGPDSRPAREHLQSFHDARDSLYPEAPMCYALQLCLKLRKLTCRVPNLPYIKNCFHFCS